MTDQRPMSPEPCDHHWIHYGQPNHSPIRWIVKCSQCNQFKIADLQEQVDVIEAAAEQRGAERGWDQAIDYAWDDSAIYQADAARAKSKNPYRADKEGDDETH